MDRDWPICAVVCDDTDPGIGLGALPAAWRARPSTAALQLVNRKESEVNKAQLVDAVTQATGDRAHATLAVESVLDAMVRAVVSGETVSVTGFGSLTPEVSPARTARNPQTGQPVELAARRVVRFRPGARFKQLVAGGRAMPDSGICIRKDPKTPKPVRP
jgi:DNA-binding protein HU-beta